MANRFLVAAAVATSLFGAGSTPSAAWLFHEHRSIAATAIAGLEARDAETLLSLWAAVRAGHEQRFCAAPSAPGRSGPALCLDFAAWTAIGGDHSCSFRELLATVQDAPWIMQVAEIADRTERELAAAKNERQKSAADVRSTLSLERVDTSLEVRAAANTGHFLMSRGEDDATLYLSSTVRGGAPLNGIGNYVRNHVAALRLAAAWADASRPPAERVAIARAALAREAFALHFLEDAFAAGHVAGCWGRPAERMGTHDYYNEHGLETMTWAGTNMILLGDRHMRAEDRDRAAAVARASLAQFLAAARGAPDVVAAALPLAFEEAWEEPAFDVCTHTTMPDTGVPLAAFPLLRDIVERTPMPGRGPGIASLPRSQAEVGGFVSWVSGTRVGVLDVPFEKGHRGKFVDGEVAIGVRAGLGLDAVTGPIGDGLIFVQAGVANRQEKGPYFSGEDPDTRIPGRTGVQFRLRAPFWLIPGDLVLAAPVLALTARDKLKQMAVTAASGGLIPWQRPMPVGADKRFQVVLGREFCVTLHGQWGADHYTLPVATAPGGPAEPHLVEIRSTEWEFPVVEYRAFRHFAGRQSYTSTLQLGVGFDRPGHVRILDAVAAPPELRTRRFIFARLNFDVRHYF